MSDKEHPYRLVCLNEGFAVQSVLCHTEKEATQVMMLSPLPEPSFLLICYGKKVKRYVLQGRKLKSWTLAK